MVEGIAVDEYDWLASPTAGVEHVDAVQVYPHCRRVKASALLRAPWKVGEWKNWLGWRHPTASRMKRTFLPHLGYPPLSRNIEGDRLDH